MLAGQVIEATTGKPVPDAMVSAGSTNWMSDGGSARTDENGNFRITRLSPGRYKPSAEIKGGYGVASETGLRGVVVDEKGQSVVGARVRARSLSNRRGGGSSQARDDGSFEIDALRPGKYRVSASKGFWGGDTLRGLPIAKVAARRLLKTLLLVARRLLRLPAPARWRAASLSAVVGFRLSLPSPSLTGARAIT